MSFIRQEFTFVCLVITILMLTVFLGDKNCRIFCAMGSRLMTAEQSTFMIDLHQIGMMLRYAERRPIRITLIH
jgi:hypothetical protein